MVVGLVGVAEAKPPGSVYDVTLDIYSQSDTSIVFYADWEVADWDRGRFRTAPDAIEFMLIVDGVIVHSHVRHGMIGAAFSYKIYTEMPMASGTKVTFAIRAINGKHVQKWQQASVVVP
jgi:hypothetical protein